MDSYEKLKQESFDQLVQSGPEGLIIYNSIVFRAGKTTGWFLGYCWGALTVFVGAVIIYWAMSAN